MPAVMPLIEQLGVQLAGAVKRLFCVKVQAAFAVKKAVTFTGLPLAVKPVSITVWGLVVMLNSCPFTFNCPPAGGLL